MAIESGDRAADAGHLSPSVADALRRPDTGTRVTVDAPGRRWSTLQWGPDSDEALLLLHGVTSSAGTWWRVGPALAAAGFRVVAPDLPGHGLTGGWRGRHRFAETAEEVAELMGTLGLPAGAMVIGHSWGAMVAAALPRTGVRPRRLVLLDPPALSMAALEEMAADPSEHAYPDVATAV